MRSRFMSNNLESNQADKRRSLSCDLLIGFKKTALLGMAAVGSVGLFTREATAQTPDFPDLPILEPAMSISAPISVPPINARPVTPVSPTPAPAVSVPPIAVPALERVEPVEIPIVSNTAPIEAAQPIVDLPAPEESAVTAISTPPLPLPVVEADALPIDATATQPNPVNRPTNRAVADLAGNAAPEPVVAEVVITDDTGTEAASRWPAPIPFGQPLP